jgi:eukaryotic-like serine/threonine-protein kinase
MSSAATLHGAVEGRDLTGTTIAGKYLVKRAIGAGGMGAVYEGQHVEIGKRVAIKVIASEHARSDELAARFRREARAASAVESEHIVHVFDVGQDESAGLYMVMEMLSGTDVSTRLERAGGALPIDEAITIIQQAARGLAKAHAAGVVHRDLKPANLFITTREDGTPCVKILDFGISKLAARENDSKQSSLTREGVVIGTPQYMSPEQAQGLAVDHRTDIWSLGAVAYEILSGHPAFAPRDTYEQMIVQIVTTKPRPLREVAPHVPAEVAAIVDATLVSDLATRLPDAATFAKRLSEAAKLPTPSSPDLAHAATVAVAAPVTPLSVPMKTSDGVVVQAQTSPGKSKTPIAIVAAVAAVLVIGGVGIAMSRRAPDPPTATGIVAPPTPSPPAVATSAEPVAKLAPLEPAPSPSASASVIASAPLKIPSKPTIVPVVRPSVTASSKPVAPSGQYGAAGVSTSY